MLELPDKAQIVKTIRSHDIGEVTEIVDQRLSVVVEVDEHEAAESLKPKRDQAISDFVEPYRLLHSGTAMQRSVEPEDPAVIGAYKGSAIAATVGHGCAAMAARIRKGADLAIFPADDD